MTDTARPFIAACAQMRSTRDPAENRDAAVRLVREASDAGAHYVQTPEMTALVERERARLFAAVHAQDDDPLIATMRDVARERGIVVHIGSLALKEGDKIANRAIVIDRAGDIVATYDKVHLFDVDLPNGESWRESATYTGGERAVLAPTPWGLLGLSICYDVRFAYLYRALAEAGASFLSAPAAFTRQTGEAHWQVLQRARAIETGSFMISAAQGGLHADGRETYGHSIIVDPWGRVLAEAGDAPGVILATIDPALVADARQRIPTLAHTRRFVVDRSAEAVAARAATA
ncbi:carbon-nitrogen hydrolase family protein [Chelatococcus sp. SYSU_G07232]|uniref:Carbon-nitrogen hydrolase family protein n=1 Tax=Chelatococcus albus TaxID=3047466 RepID=A0ABT7ADJ8_9HYPH|nr:carbon-nitrogen hydrolase family protein [Chelatococcus sp. SYSU_G07232]MDJ1157455.1 carbon-nitrogen hydrolase family protein [Chelatococcus sp. SYSU_G07232]